MCVTTTAIVHSCTKIASFCSYLRLIIGQLWREIWLRMPAEVQGPLLDMNKNNIGINTACIFVNVHSLLCYYSKGTFLLWISAFFFVSISQNIMLWQVNIVYFYNQYISHLHSDPYYFDLKLYSSHINNGTFIPSPAGGARERRYKKRSAPL